MAAGIEARQADAFIDSISVCTHFNRKDYQSLFATLKQRMADAGIRHFRDSVLCLTAGNAGFVNRLYNDHRIRGTFTTNLSGNNWPATAYNNIRKNVGFEKIAGMLGMNEPFLSKRTTAEAWNVQVNLWNSFRVNGVAAAKTIPIWPCSPTSPKEADSHRAYGLAQIAGGWPAICDGGHTHPYPGGRNPETAGWGSRVGDYNFGSLFYNMQAIGEKVGGVGRQQIATETGYRYPPSTHPNVVLESVGGIYAPRLYLYYFGFGLPSGAKNIRASIYQLLDDSEHFKLINTNGQVTPTYTALKNLITLLADPGAPFTPGSLQYQLSGWTEGVRHVLLQKRDGVFYLAIWLDKQIWDPKKQQPITVSSQAVRITFGQGVSRVDQVFPNAGTTWKSVRILDSEVAISVGPRVMLLRIVPVRAV